MQNWRRVLKTTNILNNLIESINNDAAVRSILVGAHWTIVCSQHWGMAATLLDDHSQGSPQVKDSGHLHNKSALELAEYVHSDTLLEASIGVAAINSLLPINESRAIGSNAVELLIEHGQDKNVAIVGYFPFIPKLRSIVGQLWVIDQDSIDGEYSAESAVDLIPRADVVAITSNALINHTLDGLLTLCQPEAMVMIFGPSTPLSPVMFNCGVSILSGSKVVNEFAVLRMISQGATFQQIEGVRPVTLRRDEWNS
jgi:uncharacterized protein (DUF4213/DUF364 family)